MGLKMIPQINNPNLSIKKLKFNSFEEVENVGLSAYSNKNQISLGFMPKKEKEFTEEIEKLYKIDNGFIAFTKDGKFTKLYNEKTEKILGLLLDRPPLITYINYNGEKRLIAIVKDRCLFLDGNREYLNIFEGTNYIQVGANLYAIYKNGVVFANVNDFFSKQDIDLISYIGVVTGGKILNLTCQKDRLFIFTEKVIYSLSKNDTSSDYALTKVYEHGVKILKNSIVKVGEDIYFLDEKNRLCCLQNSSVKEMLVLSKFNGKILSAFKHLDKLIYCLGDTSIYINAVDKIAYEMDTKNKEFICGEFLFSKEENALYSLTKQGGSVKIDNIYLGKNAHLERIKFVTSSLCVVEILGRFGVKKIYAGKGCIDIKLNLYSDIFSFKFDFLEDGKMQDFEIEYS